ncbi:MAG: NUDIX hydrolase [Microbacterium gubbeenense]
MANGTRVLAAGGVVWRREADELQLLLVHRKKFRDVSFPKGKLDPGETFAEAAVREIEEETGIRSALGPSLGVVTYHLPSGREKVVEYWSVGASPEQIAASTFTPNKEIEALEWVALDDARDRLSYPVDREVLAAFEELIDADGLHTFPIVLMRHGKAGSAAVDHERELTERGQEQAGAAVGALRAFGVRRILSSTARRCQQTVAPLAAALGRRVHVSDDISQDAFERGEDDPSTIIERRVEKGKPALVCSHGPVLIGLMESLAKAAGTKVTSELRAAASLSTGSFTVVHVSRSGGIVAIETHAPFEERRPA